MNKQVKRIIILALVGFAFGVALGIGATSNAQVERPSETAAKLSDLLGEPEQLGGNPLAGYEGPAATDSKDHLRKMTSLWAAFSGEEFHESEYLPVTLSTGLFLTPSLWMYGRLAQREQMLLSYIRLIDDLDETYKQKIAVLEKQQAGIRRAWNNLALLAKEERYQSFASHYGPSRMPADLLNEEALSSSRKIAREKFWSSADLAGQEGKVKEVVDKRLIALTEAHERNSRKLLEILAELEPKIREVFGNTVPYKLYDVDAMRVAELGEAISPKHFQHNISMLSNELDFQRRLVDDVLKPGLIRTRHPQRWFFNRHVPYMVRLNFLRRPAQLLIGGITGVILHFINKSADQAVKDGFVDANASGLAAQDDLKFDRKVIREFLQFEMFLVCSTWNQVRLTGAFDRACPYELSRVEHRVQVDGMFEQAMARTAADGQEIFANAKEFKESIKNKSLPSDLEFSASFRANLFDLVLRNAPYFDLPSPSEVEFELLLRAFVAKSEKIYARALAHWQEKKSTAATTYLSDAEVTALLDELGGEVDLSFVKRESDVQGAFDQQWEFLAQSNSWLSNKNLATFGATALSTTIIMLLNRMSRTAEAAQANLRNLANVDGIDDFAKALDHFNAGYARVLRTYSAEIRNAVGPEDFENVAKAFSSIDDPAQILQHAPSTSDGAQAIQKEVRAAFNLYEGVLLEAKRLTPVQADASGMRMSASSLRRRNLVAKALPWMKPLEEGAHRSSVRRLMINIDQELEVIRSVRNSSFDGFNAARAEKTARRIAGFFGSNAKFMNEMAAQKLPAHEPGARIVRPEELAQTEIADDIAKVVKGEPVHGLRNRLTKFFQQAAYSTFWFLRRPIKFGKDVGHGGKRILRTTFTARNGRHALVILGVASAVTGVSMAFTGVDTPDERLKLVIDEIETKSALRKTKNNVLAERVRFLVMIKNLFDAEVASLSQSNQYAFLHGVLAESQPIQLTVADLAAIDAASLEALGDWQNKIASDENAEEYLQAEVYFELAIKRYLDWLATQNRLQIPEGFSQEEHAALNAFWAGLPERLARGKDGYWEELIAVSLEDLEETISSIEDSQDDTNDMEPEEANSRN